MIERTISGGCQCGAVRYTVRAPATEMEHCHCSMCRKIHGAIFVTFAVFPRDAFSIDKGADDLATYDSSPKVHRKFCRTCGAHIMEVADDAPERVYVAVGTIDGGAHPGHPEGAIKHIFVGSKVPWYEITDGLPQHEEF